MLAQGLALALFLPALPYPVKCRWCSGVGDQGRRGHHNKFGWSFYTYILNEYQ